MADDKRRAGRVPVELRVMVQGVDDSMVLRSGNISSTGLMFIADQPLAEVGALESLHLGLANESAAMTIMAQLVRATPIGPEDTAIAHAFEFYPQSEDVQRRLIDLLDEVGASGSIEPAITTENLPSATVFRLTIDDLTFTTSWPIALGTKVQIALTSLDGRERIPFEGDVISAEPEGTGHRVEVRLSEPGVRLAPTTSALTQSTSITGSLDLLFAEWMASQDIPRETKTHMVGRLDRVPLSGLLMLFDMERLSGELKIEQDDGEFTLFLNTGTVIDAAPAVGAELRALLQRMANARSGRFEFVACDVTRPDRIGMSTTALLLDLAREHDEESR